MAKPEGDRVTSRCITVAILSLDTLAVLLPNFDRWLDTCVGSEPIPWRSVTLSVVFRHSVPQECHWDQVP